MPRAELVGAVCETTGNSYESVRGTLIKRDCRLFNEGWQYKDGAVVRGDGEAVVVDYTPEAKLRNWEVVRAYLPLRIDTLVTLGGIGGTDIRVFLPDQATSYDYDATVLSQLKRNIPWVETVQGDIFDHSEPATVLNLDLVGYMCGSRFSDFQRAASVGHQYIVITIQGQVGGFRNNAKGEWVSQALKKYKRYRDRNLRALKDAMAGYKLLLNRFYQREAGARRMRTTVWKREV
jgi:hypothetical protein